MYSHSLEHNRTQTYGDILIGALVIASLLFSYFTPLALYAEGEEIPPAETTETPPPPPPPPPPEETPIETQTTEEVPITEETQTPEEVSNPTDPSGDAVVDTGDATAVGQSETTANTTSVTTEPETPPAEETTPPAEEATQTETETPITEEIPLPPGNTDVTASNTNDAGVENNADVGAETGENTAATAGTGTAVVETGDATSVANVLNVVNTNIFNSEGFFLFLDNLLSSLFGLHLDLRGLEFWSAASEDVGTNTNPCDGTCAALDDVELTNTNTAEITNNVVVRSETGGNEATSGSGDALVITGNAYAAANVINVANTNIIDSNYLLMTFNNFGTFEGDIILPAAQAFLDIFGGSGGLSSDASMTNNNTASVGNGVTVEADTGGNIATASGGGDAGVVTGDSSASANVVNQVNQNLFGAGSFQILFRIHGNWNGNIFGAPEGLSWRETGGGVELLFDGSLGGLGASMRDLTISNENNAVINNNIGVFALTGDNRAAGGRAGVTTGNAYAAANVINVANTNVIGRNWLMAIINIFGDWNGNISFGRPDLWIAGRIEHDGRPNQGEEVTYHFTVANNGDADAHNVYIEHLFEPNRLEFTGYMGGVHKKGEGRGTLVWNVGTIPAGEYREFAYHAVVTPPIPFGSSLIETEVSVGADEPEDNLADNTDILSLEAFRENSNYVYGTHVNYSPSSLLVVSKTNSVGTTTVMASSTVSYTITIDNRGGGSAYQAYLVDTLRDEKGKVLYEEEWSLGEIRAGEHIEVTYDSFFSEQTKTGKYTNTAQVYALTKHDTFLYGIDGSSNKAKNTIFIQGLLDSDGVPPPKVIDESVIISDIENTIDFLSMRLNELMAQANRKEDPLYNHPLFTQHPVHIGTNETPRYTAPAYTVPKTPKPTWPYPWMTAKPGTGDFTRFISLPIGNISHTRSSEEISYLKALKDGNMLALMALGMFVLQ